MANSLLRAIKESVLRRLAGDRSYQRGQDYFLHGHVGELSEDDCSVQASVRGSQDYRVELTVEDDILDYSCDCPVGLDGVFCKHCVATALAWLEKNASTNLQPPRKSKKLNLAEARKLWLTEDKETIVQTLFEWAKTDFRLRERLILHAARRKGSETAVAAVQDSLTRAIRVPGLLEYREMPSYARRVNEAIDLVEQLLHEGHPAAVIRLCESALTTLCRSLETLEDSDGRVGGLLQRLQNMHHQACIDARPDPAELAKRLFHWELQSEWDVFSNAISRYAKVLGPEGVQAYPRLAEQEWAKVPARTVRSEDSSWDKYFRITSIMENLASAIGDLDALIGIMSRDLASPYQYLRISEACRKAGESDKALDWAERGLKAFPSKTDGRLCEFVAEEYQQRGRHQEALELIWSEFVGQPFLQSYKLLESYASQAGAWNEWRQRAFLEIRKRIQPTDRSGARIGRGWRTRSDHSELVEVFLYEGDVEAAWREAHAGGCAQHLWLRLAETREAEHPEEAAPIYLRQADALVQAGGKAAYDSALDLLVKLAALMKRLNKSQEFVQTIDSLRVKHRLKRNFIKLLQQKEKLLL